MKCAVIFSKHSFYYFARHAIAIATITMRSFETWLFEAHQNLSKRNPQANGIWQNHVIYLQVFERIYQSQAEINLIKT